MKKSKNPTQIENCLGNKFPGWFDHKNKSTYCFITVSWLFSANWCFHKIFYSKLTLRWSDTPWCIFDIPRSCLVHWDTLAHWHIISRSYRLQWWSGWVRSAEQSLFVSAALFFCYTLYVKSSICIAVHCSYLAGCTVVAVQPVQCFSSRVNLDPGAILMWWLSVSISSCYDQFRPAGM